MGKQDIDTKQGILKKEVCLEKITINESKSKRIGKNFTILHTNRKLRKTLDYYGRKKANNVLDPTIILREKRSEQDYYFVCLDCLRNAVKRTPMVHSVI